MRAGWACGGGMARAFCWPWVCACAARVRTYMCTCTLCCTVRVSVQSSSVPVRARDRQAGPRVRIIPVNVDSTRILHSTTLYMYSHGTQLQGIRSYYGAIQHMHTGTTHAPWGKLDSDPWPQPCSALQLHAVRDRVVAAVLHQRHVLRIRMQATLTGTVRTQVNDTRT